MITEVWDLIRDTLQKSFENDFFSGGFMLGILTTVFYSLKGVPIWIWTRVKRNLMYEVYFDNKTDIYYSFSEWYHKHYPYKFKRVEIVLQKKYEREKFRIDSTSGSEPEINIQYTQFNDVNLLWYNRRVLVIRKSMQMLENAGSVNVSQLQKYEISGLFAKSAIQKLIGDVYQEELRKRNNYAIRVNYNDSYGGFSYRDRATAKTLDKVFIKDKDKLLADINKFISSSEKYKRTGVCHKRGYLFHGKPGTGKTTLAMAMALHINLDFYVINLATVKDGTDLQSMINDIPNDSLILFDDVDVIFKEGDRETKVKGLDMSSILNVLDGPFSPEGVIFVMATNHIEKLDPALIRTGRIDYIQEIDFPENKEIQEFMSACFGKSVSLTNDFSGRLPMSDIQDICLKSDNQEQAEQLIEELIQKNNER